MRMYVKLAVALFTLLALLLAPLCSAARGVMAGATAHTGVTAACAALGTYLVGPRSIVPQPKAAQTGGVAVLYLYGTGTLTGTVSLAAYSGCGVPTAGSFAVHASLVRPYLYPSPPRTGGSGSGVIAQPAIFGTIVLTATGTFAQDPGHPKDAGYVSVRGTVSYGRYGCAPLCEQPQTGGAIPCPQDGCRQQGKPVVTRVATFTGITGYLRVLGGPAAALTLLFLPPPDSADASALSTQALSLYGIRMAP